MGRCWKVLGDECNIRNLGIRYHDTRAFTDSPGLPRPLLALLRLVFASLAIADLVWVGLDHPRGEWIIYFNNWSRVFVALYFLVGFIVLIHRSCCGTKESDQYEQIHESTGNELSFLSAPASHSTSCGVKPGETDDTSGAVGTNRLSWHHEVLWVLHTIAADTSFVCMIAYFAFFFDEEYTLPGLFDLPRHVLYVVFLIVDTLCSHIPVRLLHVIYANIVGAAYIAFTMIYLLTEVKIDLRLDPLTYPSLEFGDRPLLYTAYLAIFLIVGFPVSQVFFFLIYKFRASVTSS